MNTKKKYNYERLEMLRKDKGLTQTDIAKKLCISQRSYSHYELGEINIPLDILRKLALLHHTSIDYILDLTDTPKPYPRKKNKIKE